MNRPNCRRRAVPLGANFRLAAAFVLSSVLWVARPAVAAPSQKDVFKSIQESMGKQEESDSRPLLLLLCGGGVIVLLVVVGSRRQQKATSPEPLNHPGKLLKEVLKDVPLKSAEMKQLKLLADALATKSGEEAGPLTLLLCPSLMAKGLKEPTPRLDRKMIAQVVRKLRLGQTGSHL
ncbi:MAG TPA: hypothetical protein VLJ39_11385 [Tepidisphaeraceae bacterium]|nr:hypothetical protein [Tepidisphaeraceae bacterium]